MPEWWHFCTRGNGHSESKLSSRDALWSFGRRVGCPAESRPRGRPWFPGGSFLTRLVTWQLTKSQVCTFHSRAPGYPAGSDRRSGLTEARGGCGWICQAWCVTKPSPPAPSFQHGSHCRRNTWLLKNTWKAHERRRKETAHTASQSLAGDEAGLSAQGTSSPQAKEPPWPVEARPSQPQFPDLPPSRHRFHYVWARECQLPRVGSFSPSRRPPAPTPSRPTQGA